MSFSAESAGTASCTRSAPSGWCSLRRDDKGWRLDGHISRSCDWVATSQGLKVRLPGSTQLPRMASLFLGPG
ncbi:hypothetical protein DUNSADRAFT_3608 [Dunaliella salina]|uniref:Encoded protein n=1 Tax=Dunaliella salina TaxID=3046 RepID=A0ABQ7FVB2_DUNSA|nr:hypothetical protein DUNSADRAFT_3608 [Dunaliella salina]|eukprot:KAF5826319.1 hypothetical protein DUNSADRAFT_3608 [Dunaliella salina]